FFDFYAEYADWNHRLAVEGLGIDDSFEARHAELYRTLAGGFAPTLQQLGIGTPAVAAFALMGMAAQLAYWQHYQRQGEPSMTPAALAQACASLFINGAASMPVHQTPEGGSHA